jgi:hypothetical protein
VGQEKIETIDPEKFRNIIELNPALLGLLLGIPTTVDPTRELMITDLSVVNDPARTFDTCTNTGTPMGIWTFGHLMSEMANQPVTGNDPSDFVRKWLSSWETNQSINGFTVPNRNSGIHSRIIDSWPKLANGKLDLSKAPFRLLAIVNRVDLRQSFVYGGGAAGEARFVFGAVDQANPCGSILMTAIFEYGIKRNSCPELHAWAQQWHNLGSIALGPPGAFNVALQAITDQFTVAGADPAKPNGSALNQLRTNEIALNFPWELREFHIVPSGQFQEVVVKQTPDTGLNNQAVLRDYINANEAAILNGSYVVPPTFPGTTPFLGGSSINNQDFWNGPATINNNDARQQFSVGTCNGCHGGEAKTSNFLQIAPRNNATAATLAPFLTGENIPDPVSGVNRHFDDLTRRQQDLDSLLNSSCLSLGFLRELFFVPLNMTH